MHLKEFMTASILWARDEQNRSMLTNGDYRIRDSKYTQGQVIC
jgi:hypothetical protein